MKDDLRYLLATLDPADRRKLVVNGLVQFVLAMLDLLGVAAILPLMQVMMGASLQTGMLGTLHRWLGAPGRNQFVLVLAALMIAAFVLKAVFALWISWWSASNIMRMQTQTARRLLDTYMHESYLRHRQRNTGELIRNVGTAVVDAHTKVLGGLISVISSLMSIVLIIALLLFVSPVPTLLATVYFGAIVFVIQRVLGPANRRAGVESQHTSWISSHALVDAMQGFREAVLHNARGYFVDKFDAANKRTAHASMRANYLATMPKYLLEVATMIGLTAFIVISILTSSAQQAMPTMSIFVGATIKMLPVMVALTATIGTIRSGREGLHITVESLRSLRDDPPPAPTAPSDGSFGSRTGEIKVSHVRFRYPTGDRDVLDDIDVTVPRGSSLALCGVSGSGKTTLVDIILGLLAPTSGEVTFDGVPTTTAGDAWHELVAFVPQDVYLSDATLAGNVAFGVPADQYDEARVVDALERAALGDFLTELPDGLDTLVGERGTRLSGGQRQRVGIARALYRNPRVLVLDEATSALDNETEHRITSTLDRLHGDITTIVVAHRLSTVRDVDNLAYLENGRVVASGTFGEVVQQSPSFAHLVALGRLDGPPHRQETT